MRREINWDEYKFRASQCSKLLTGQIPRENEFDERILELQKEKKNLINKNGNKVKWTANKEKELKTLIGKKETPIFKRLPKTMVAELRKIHRAETFGRNFNFTNKYVQKGLEQEEDAITIYQKYRNEVLGIKTFFKNNKERLENEYISGEADLTDTNDFSNCNEGFDTKCSWELETLPYKEDSLDIAYETQNQCYMWLSKCGKWTTASILVNTTEHLLNNEKLKWFYALGSPMDEEHINYNEYVKKAKELEVRYIFDYNKFVKDNPSHIMEISKKEWFENGYDIPLKDRVVEKISLIDDNKINDLKDRIILSRAYLKYLDDK